MAPAWTAPRQAISLLALLLGLYLQTADCQLTLLPSSTQVTTTTTTTTSPTTTSTSPTTTSTSSTNRTTASTSTGNSSGLEGWAIALIVLGALATAAALGFLFCCLCCKSKFQSSQDTCTSSRCRPCCCRCGD